MSLCINPSCSNPSNLDSQLFCVNCNSELLLDGRFRVQASLGEGGFARTYEVYNLRGEIQVLKVLSRKEPKAIELFQREARVLSQLVHPGIPRVEPNSYFIFFPQGASEPLHCLTMEKIVGLDLKHYVLRRGKGVEQKTVFQWLQQLVEILQTVHSQHVLHRDIKPSNIMLRTDGHLVLIDFGTVRSETHIGSMYTRVMSELYTPDEQMRGKAVPQSDFFALGRTAIFLLTGQDLKILYEPNSNEIIWRHLIPELAPEFGNLLDRLTAPFPSQRPASAEILLEELQRIEPIVQGTSLFLSSGGSSGKLGNIPTSPPEPTIRQVGNDSAPPPVNYPSVPNKSSSSSTNSKGSTFTLSPSFVERCQKALTEFVGPIAPILCKRILEKHPHISEQEFVDMLCAKLPNPQDADRFRKTLFF